MSLLTAFEPPVCVVLVGASGGIGRAVLDCLLNDANVSQVYALSRTRPADAEALQARHGDRLRLGQIKLTDEASITEAARQLSAESPQLVLTTTGMLYTEDQQPEKSWRALAPDYFHQQMQINALGPALLAKHLIPLLPKDRRALFAALSARVGSIGDNRLGGWYSYRASKAALNMLLRCTAIEAKRRWPQLVVAGLHPGTVDTPLSQPFQARVPEGKLFTPAFAAESLLRVLNGLTPEQSGQVFAWDGQRIQP